MTEQHGDDPAHQLVSSTTRATLMAATVTAEQLARSWRNQTERRAEMAISEAERWQARYDSQRRLAGIEVSTADQRWIHAVDVDQVARVWETARAWSELEPAEFGATADRIRDLVQEQYGVDLAQTATPGLDELQGAAWPESRSGRDAAAAAGDDGGGAVVATGGRDADSYPARDGSSNERDSDSSAAGHNAWRDSTGISAVATYDTDQRRAHLLDRAAAGGADRETAEGRARAANAQAHPARDAGALSPRRPSATQPRHTANPLRTRKSERGQ